MDLLIRRAAAAALALLWAGCFDPSERDGVVSCAADGSCPPGFLCNPPDDLCYRELPAPDRPDAASPITDAAAADAPAADAGGPDAAPLSQCADGVDNDCDGRIDFGVDPGCASEEDDDEHGSAECDDGLDNDEDGDTDFQISSPSCDQPGDTNCNSPFDDQEN